MHPPLMIGKQALTLTGSVAQVPAHVEAALCNAVCRAGAGSMPELVRRRKVQRPLQPSREHQPSSASLCELVPIGQCLQLILLDQLPGLHCQLRLLAWPY